MEETKPYGTITIEGFGDFNIAKPTFEVYAAACSRLTTSRTDPDAVKAGKVIFDSCYLGNNLSLEEIQKNPALYVSICLVAVQDIEIFEGELKKN
jgi:hypothetical protein